LPSKVEALLDAQLQRHCMQIVNVSYYAPTARVDRQCAGAVHFVATGGFQMNSIIFKIMMLNEQIKAFRRDEKGATMIKYALVGAIIAVAAIAVLGTVSNNLNGVFTAFANRLANAPH
jgi:Flp pilus assembly pilin Flp